MGQFHEQVYFQFKDCQIFKTAKEILGHKGIHFPKYLNGDSKQNLDYSQKKWNRCRCDYQIREKICNVCNESCIENRTLARWTIKKDDKLPQEMVGPWKFGEYQVMPAYKNDQKELDEINEIQIDDLNRKKRIRDKEITYEQVLLNPKKLMPIDYFSSPYSHQKITKDQYKLKHRQKKILEKNFYPKNFYFMEIQVLENQQD
ncbi:hypothetical protein F8M41_004415 [Gigaspora margarita]|uniref:Uncharacterized protein n=1 Tax=Gigaspora margarita TaxID=4874 RepID=A0A8H4B4T2_GIGMA|nr:hypothetical protein F8M41_004415 [Gigaspora margarita]